MSNTRHADRFWRVVGTLIATISSGLGHLPAWGAGEEAKTSVSAESPLTLRPRSIAPSAASSPRTPNQEKPSMWMTVGTQRFAVALEDNPGARALQQLLPITLDMEELNGNEKHAALPRSLPTSSARPGTIRAGDVMLYGDNTLVVFYQTFASSYSYTRIGRIEGSDGLASALGAGNQRVTFALR